jgi:trehalose 6-phosphate synthase/phosphatase
MFRALAFPSVGDAKLTLEAPVSVSQLDKDAKAAPPVQLALKPEWIFTTAVGPRSKRTLASWHVTTPAEVVAHILDLVKKR